MASRLKRSTASDRRNRATRRSGRRQLPEILALRAPRELARGPIEVGVRVRPGRERIGSVRAAIRTALGDIEAVFPASAAGLTAASASGVISIDARGLPAGPAELRVSLVTARGTESKPRALALEVPGGGEGDAPEIVAARPEQTALVRPRGRDRVNAWFRLDVRPRACGVAGLFMAATAADGSVRTSGLPLAAGEVTLRLLSFGADDPLGRYTLSLTAIAADGAASSPIETSIELSEREGAQGPRIEAVRPSRARRGDKVAIVGANLTAPELLVLIAGQRVGVLSAKADRLDVLAPAIDTPGAVTVVTRAGEAIAPGPFTPEPSISIIPRTFVLPAGEKTQLAAVVSGAPSARVRWRLRGTGAAGLRIDSHGNIDASRARARGRVEAIATVAGRRGLAATARGEIVPAVASGPTRIGPAGGTVRAADGCVISIPKGALKDFARVSIRRLGTPRGEERWRVIAAARLEPAGLKLPRRVKVEIPLRTYLAPGTRVPLHDGRGRPLDIAGVVTRHGNALAAWLDRIPGPLHGHWPFDDFGVIVSPAISIVSPSQIDEGATLPFLVQGSNFVPGLTTISLHEPGGGAQTSDVEVRTVYVTADGTTLGVTLKALVVTQFGEGAIRTLNLRVTTPAGSAEHPIDIICHDEIDLNSGAVTISASKSFSRIFVNQGGLLRIAAASPPVALNAFETVFLWGQPPSGGVELIPGHGAAGGTGSAGGAGGAGGALLTLSLASRGGAGGAGGGNGSTSGEAGAAGAAGATLGGSGGSFGPGGAGGTGGAAGGGGPFPHAGGDGTPGSPAPNPVLVGASDPFSPTSGSGGGGGGAGGGEGWVFTQSGGGGGGGGAGAGAFSIAAGEFMRITGEVSALGGDGGPGGRPVSGVPSYAYAGFGAGGGGGAGGNILLQGVDFGFGPVLALGGANFPVPLFDPSRAPADARPRLARLLADRSHNGNVQIDGPDDSPSAVPAPFRGPDLDYRFDLVSTTATATVQVSGSDSLQVRVSNRQGNSQVTPVAAGARECTVSLFDGFNDLNAESPDYSLSTAPIRRRTLLRLSGVVSDFGFTCSIAPSTAVVATERSLDLTVTVTGTSLTAITWSVVGGDPYGTVTQSGRYTAPTLPAPGGVTVLASSAYDPSRRCATQITVIPGISIQSTAQIGFPARQRAYSANVGQTIVIREVSGQQFNQTEQVQFQTVTAGPNGCVHSSTAVTGTAGLGLQTLVATVPADVDAEQVVRVPGHGSANLQIVPTVSSVSAPGGQTAVIQGSGFVCGGTTVLANNVPVPAAQVTSITGSAILVAASAIAGLQVSVQTAGGTSNSVQA